MGAYYTLCRFLSIGTCKAFYHSHSHCYRPLSINTQVWGGHFTVGPSSGIQLDSNLAIWSAQWRYSRLSGTDTIFSRSPKEPLMDASHRYLARSYGSTQACVRGYSISIVFVLSCCVYMDMNVRRPSASGCQSVQRGWTTWTNCIKLSWRLYPRRMWECIDMGTWKVSVGDRVYHRLESWRTPFPSSINHLWIL